MNQKKSFGHTFFVPYLFLVGHRQALPPTYLPFSPSGSEAASRSPVVSRRANNCFGNSGTKKAKKASSCPLFPETQRSQILSDLRSCLVGYGSRRAAANEASFQGVCPLKTFLKIILTGPLRFVNGRIAGAPMAR